jgi:hypothetical protein
MLNVLAFDGFRLKAVCNTITKIRKEDGRGIYSLDIYQLKVIFYDHIRVCLGSFRTCDMANPASMVELANGDVPVPLHLAPAPLGNRENRCNRFMSWWSKMTP